jgi:hypothetical protein
MTSIGKASASGNCEIYGVLRKNALFWKWRYSSADGSTTDGAEEYRLFLQCAAAARALGYEPRADWTRPCASITSRHEAPAAALPK